MLPEPANFDARYDAATRAIYRTPLSKGGGGDNSGWMEARVAALEIHVQHIREDLSEMKKDVRDLKSEARTDFRLIFGALITVALGLAAMMAKGFHWF
jgi:hypothetical protein